MHAPRVLARQKRVAKGTHASRVLARQRRAYPVGSEKRSELFEVKSMNRHVELPFEFVEVQAVQKNRFVALQGDLRNDREVATHLIARREKVATRQETRDTYVATKVIVSDRRDVQLRPKHFVESADELLEHRREQCSRENRSVQSLSWRSGRSGDCTVIAVRG